MTNPLYSVPGIAEGRRRQTFLYVHFSFDETEPWVSLKPRLIEKETNMRLRADFWVSAYLRRCDIEGAVAVLRRRGAAEAGAIYVKLDRLDRHAALYGPAPQTEIDGLNERRFIRLHRDEWIDPGDAEARLAREIGFDGDIWIVEVEDRLGRTFLDLIDQ